MMSQTAFAKMHEIPEDRVNQFTYHNRDLDVIVKVGEEYHIDDKALMLYHKQNTKLFNLSHDAYFKIQDYGVRDSDQSNFMHRRDKGSRSSWNSLSLIGVLPQRCFSGS